MALPQGKYANPSVADRDYEKQASPVVYTSLKGWTKEKDNLGRPDEPTKAIKANWEMQLADYAAQVVLTNRHDWSLDENAPNRVKLVGGLDISFARGNKIDAVVCLAVCSYPSMKVVFEAYKMIKLTAPYIPGYLNFREVPYYEELLEEVRINHPEFLPQVILVDGNGIIHPRACGCACQLAVVTGIPCVGVAKNLLVIDGISDDKIEAAFRQTGSRTVNIVGKTGKVHGQVRIRLQLLLLPNASLLDLYLIRAVCFAL
jgi:deoxyinosine 3'endonuclease (endonuclease V)